MDVRQTAELPINLVCTAVGLWEKAGVPTVAKKSPTRGLNQELSCCEATQLIPTSRCHAQVVVDYYLWVTHNTMWDSVTKTDIKQMRVGKADVL